MFIHNQHLTFRRLPQCLERFSSVIMIELGINRNPVHANFASPFIVLIEFTYAVMTYMICRLKAEVVENLRCR